MSCRAVLISALLPIGTAACVAAHPGYSDITDYMETPSEYQAYACGRAGEIKQVDLLFVFHAGVADLYDIALAELAEQKSSNLAIAHFARSTRADATLSHWRLTLVAQSNLGIAPPLSLDRDHAIARDQIAALEGAAFDTAYLRAAVRSSDATLALYTHEARFGGPPVMNRFAFAGVPRLDIQKQFAEALAARQGR